MHNNLEEFVTYKCSTEYKEKVTFAYELIFILRRKQNLELLVFNYKLLELVVLKPFGSFPLDVMYFSLSKFSLSSVVYHGRVKGRT